MFRFKNIEEGWNSPPILGEGPRLDLKKKEVTTERELGLRLKGLLKTKSLGAVLIEDFPFSSYGALSRILAGNFPKRSKIREKFDLPPMVSVVGCPNCGEAHTMRACRPKRAQVKRECSVGWVLEVAGMLKEMEEAGSE